MPEIVQKGTTGRYPGTVHKLKSSIVQPGTPAHAKQAPLADPTPAHPSSGEAYAIFAQVDANDQQTEQAATPDNRALPQGDRLHGGHA